ncbi:hypothetical protein GQX74_003134 [Glossina fuscipes]|nr:hypothetical protein GQX74_003134 [Glossina fuscipes]
MFIKMTKSRLRRKEIPKRDPKEVKDICDTILNYGSYYYYEKEDNSEPVENSKINDREGTASANQINQQTIVLLIMDPKTQ